MDIGPYNAFPMGLGEGGGGWWQWRERGGGGGRDSTLLPATVLNVDVRQVCRFDRVMPSAFRTQYGALSRMFALQTALPN